MTSCDILADQAELVEEIMNPRHIAGGGGATGSTVQLGPGLLFPGITAPESTRALGSRCLVPDGSAPWGDLDRARSLTSSFTPSGASCFTAAVELPPLDDIFLPRTPKRNSRN